MHPTRIRRSALPVVLVLGLVSLPVVADTFIVAPPGAMPPPDFNTIQEAIGAAVGGDCINVEPGTYVENIDFLGLAITVQSTGGEDVTIIDGSACTRGSGTCSVVTFANGEDGNSILDGFTVTGGDGAPSGGGIYCDSASPTILNCTISGNTASVGGGGGLWNNSSSPTLINCTISGNTANSGGGLWNNSASPTLTNSILWGDTPDEIVGSATVTFSDVQGGYSGSGNIDLDPLFANAAAGDFHLLPCSPCIDSGDNTAPSLPATDFEGDPRIDNGTVDMGVDEVVGGPGPCPPLFIRGDANDDDIINIADGIFLLTYLFQSGAAPTCFDASDFNDDEFMDISDTIYLIRYLFVMGSPPLPPFLGCGTDPAGSMIDCSLYVNCP